MHNGFTIINEEHEENSFSTPTSVFVFVCIDPSANV